MSMYENWDKDAVDYIEGLEDRVSMLEGERNDLKEAVDGLLNFISNKYEVKDISEFTCPHHLKLAELVRWQAQ